MKRPPERPVLITDAAPSLDHQLRSRQFRYVLMMSIRAGCLILGAVLISLQVPLLPLWLALCAFGMVLLPWMAVLIANDRPARSRAERAAARQRRADQQPAVEAMRHPTIDAEP